MDLPADPLAFKGSLSALLRPRWVHMIKACGIDGASTGSWPCLCCSLSCCASWTCGYSNAGTNVGDYELTSSGEPFNEAYRYVDWLLTVPLLLVELLCVMDLPTDQLASKVCT